MSRVPKPKQIVRIAVLVGIAVFILSQTSLNEMRYASSEYSYKTAKVAKILGAIQLKDSGAIMRLFSKNTVEAVGEQGMQEGIEYLFTVIQGDIECVEVSRVSHGGWVYDWKDSWLNGDYGKRFWQARIYATITTDVDVYDLYVADYLFNSLERGETGVSKIALLRQEDREQYYKPFYSDWFFQTDFRGVFRTDILGRAIAETGVDVSGDKKLEAVTEALENDDTEAIVGLFSGMARELVGEDKLAAGAAYSSKLFDGDVDGYYMSSLSAKRQIDIEDGKVVLTNYMWYDLFRNKDTESEERYFLYIRDVLINELHPDQVGIDRLMLIGRGEDHEWVNPGEAFGSEAYGIYCSERADPDEYIVNLGESPGK